MVEANNPAVNKRNPTPKKTKHLNIRLNIFTSDYMIKISLVIATIGNKAKNIIIDISYRPTFLIPFNLIKTFFRISNYLIRY
jgi:hypothetical protein